MLRCGDGTLYIGISNRLETRLANHRAGKGARYTRGRGPLELLYVESVGKMGEALSRERQLKRLKRKDKLKLAGVSP
jgi:putative endonuclease